MLLSGEARMPTSGCGQRRIESTLSHVFLYYYSMLKAIRQIILSHRRCIITGHLVSCVLYIPIILHSIPRLLLKTKAYFTTHISRDLNIVYTFSILH